MCAVYALEYDETYLRYSADNINKVVIAMSISTPYSNIASYCVQAGFDALDTIVILGNQATVDKLKKNDSKFGMDIDLIVGKDSSLSQTDSSWTEAETAVCIWQNM